jgi:hypothetical protein
MTVHLARPGSFVHPAFQAWRRGAMLPKSIPRIFRLRMIGARKAGFGVNRPAPTDEFARAVAVAMADARRRLAQEEAERGAWTDNST